MPFSHIPERVLANFRNGTAIPAEPLALNADRTLNEKYQRALCRYYIDSGVGGIAVGVHSTQFEIREPSISLFEPVLSLCSEEINFWCQQQNRQILKISGVCGETKQALYEADFARKLGYHACLLSLAALKDADTKQLIKHCREISSIIPVIGFYLQPAVGGMNLPYDFWREFVEIPGILGIKMAPFNRYKTFDVVRAVCDAGREDDITLYTGNDDNIVIDLLTEFCIRTNNRQKRIRIKGGLLGHFSCWTKSCVELLQKIHKDINSSSSISSEWLTRAAEITDCNAAFFDAANNFSGCIPGIHEVLRRQGLLVGTWCLNPNEILSEGQSAEIDRVYNSYPYLNDDEFVRQHLDSWLS